MITNARLWYQIDARDQIVYPLSQYITEILTGRTRPTYHPLSDLGDHVVVTNSRHIVFPGEREWETKIYSHHTGKIQGKREYTAQEIHETDPCQILWREIRGLMPKVRSRNEQMKRLHIFPDNEHPFAQNIYARLIPPFPQPRRLEEYTKVEIDAYPRIFDAK